jgi:hypothetical protein
MPRILGYLEQLLYGNVCLCDVELVHADPLFRFAGTVANHAA